MNFRIKKIQKKETKPWIIHKKKLLIAAIIIIALLSTITLANFFRSGEIRILPKSPLQTDQYGHTNFVLLGVAGKNEEGGFLSDSILIASLNPKTPSISFISLPRDLFIPSEVGDRKINEIFAIARYQNDKNDQAGLEVIKDALSDFTGLPMHYGVVVNFDVFENVVDALGGIDLFVPKDIIDHKYPGPNYSYQTFVVRKGKQHLDGSAALKYARSRYTTSDYDRAKRQQDLLLAIRNKASQINLFSDFDKLKEFHNIYKQNIISDLSITEIIALARIASNLEYQNVLSNVLNDDPTQKGGFLYTPAREFYGGQFVLLPENLKDTKKFIHLNLAEPEILLENAQLAILNGSKISGKAGTLAQRLRRFGFHIIDIGNYNSEKPVFESFFTNANRTEETTKTQEFIKEFLQISPHTTSEHHAPKENSLTDINIILGTN